VFSDHRTRPGIDLINAIPILRTGIVYRRLFGYPNPISHSLHSCGTCVGGAASVKTVYDLGCGAGR
jgi:trans-aconitate methyltransferase